MESGEDCMQRREKSMSDIDGTPTSMIYVAQINSQIP